MKRDKKCFMVLLSLWVSLMCVTTLFAQSPRGGGIPRDALPESLKGLDIKDYFIFCTQKKVGVIHALSGTVVVRHRGTREAYFGREGDTIFENDALNALSGSRCRIRFLDEDLVTMAADTEFAVENFEDQRDQGRKDSLYSMVRGKAMFYAMRLFGYKDVRFRLQTPTAIVGVRGTQFGAHVYWLEEEKRGDLGLQVADGGNQIAMYLAQAGGARSFTDAFSLDGIVDVVVANVTNLVFPGNMFNGSLGRIVPTPPEILRSFERETSVGGRGESEAGAGEEKVPVPDTGRTTPEETVHITEKQTGTVQQNTGVQTEQKEKEKQKVVYDHGYFTAMLLNDSPSLEDVFISQQRQAFTQSMGEASSILDPATTPATADNVRWDGDEKGAVGVYSDVTTSEDSVSHNNINISTQPVFFGALNYLDYGYWIVSQTSFNPASFHFVDLAWWIRGQATPDAAMSGFHGSAAYSGVAHGTYFQDLPSNFQPLLLHGTFSANVNFDTASVNHFTVNVKTPDNSHSVLISDANGSFSSSQFRVHIDNGGTWNIDGNSATYGQAHGSLFGPGGEEIGGVWGIKRPGVPNQAATGIFAGSKK